MPLVPPAGQAPPQAPPVTTRAPTVARNVAPSLKRRVEETADNNSSRCASPPPACKRTAVSDAVPHDDCVAHDHSRSIPHSRLEQRPLDTPPLQCSPEAPAPAAAFTQHGSAANALASLAEDGRMAVPIPFEPVPTAACPEVVCDVDPAPSSQPQPAQDEAVPAPVAGADTVASILQCQREASPESRASVISPGMDLDMQLSAARPENLRPSALSSHTAAQLVPAPGPAPVSLRTAWPSASTWHVVGAVALAAVDYATGAHVASTVSNAVPSVETAIQYAQPALRMVSTVSAVVNSAAHCVRALRFASRQ